MATDRPVTSIGPAIKRTIETLGTQRPVHDLLPMRAYVDRAMGDTRFTMLIIVAFATTTLVLAGIGLYGTLAYVTAQRRREFGVRMTPGASGRRVLADVVREGLLLASIGTLIGAAGAVAVGRLLRELLYGVAPLDASRWPPSPRWSALSRSWRRFIRPCGRPAPIPRSRCAPIEAGVWGLTPPSTQVPERCGLVSAGRLRARCR